MHTNHNEHKTHTKITSRTLNEWANNDLFLVTFQDNPEAEFVRMHFLREALDQILNLYEAETEVKNDCSNPALDTDQLLFLFRFLHIFRHQSQEYYETLQALNEVFIFDGTPWFQTIFSMCQQDKGECLIEQAKTLFFVLKQFTILTKHPLIRKLTSYDQLIELIVDFSRMLPQEPARNSFAQACANLLSGPILSYDLITDIKEKGFRQTFILLFLNDHKEFHNKIYASQHTKNYDAQLASCFNILIQTRTCGWKDNILNTRLLCDYPEKAADLYAIFSNIYKDINKNSLLSTEKTYHKIMHPLVLDNLVLLKKEVIDEEDSLYSERVDNFLNGIIACHTFFKIYPLLLVHLPKDIAGEIFYRFLLLMHAVPVKNLVINPEVRKKRIVFPLSDSMIDELDEQDILDIKQAFPVSETPVLNMLSAPYLELLLKKLGKPFVRTKVFTLDLSMKRMLEGMTLDCQKIFYHYLGSDHVSSHLTDKNTLPFLAFHGFEKESFALLLSIFDSLKYITEYAMNHKLVLESYQFLNAINQINSDLCDKALEKLGREWVIATNKSANKLFLNLNALDMKLQLRLIKQIGSEQLQTLFYSFGELQYLLRLTFQEVQMVLVGLIGDAHFSNLSKNRTLSASYGTLYYVFSKTETAHKMLDILHIDSQFLLNVFEEPRAIFSFHNNDAPFITHLERIGPVREKWLDNPETVKVLLNLIPPSYYATFFKHLIITETVPSWHDLRIMYCRNTVALYEAIPESFFARNPMNLKELLMVDLHVYPICIEKIPAETLKSMMQDPDFYKSIPESYKTRVFACLLQKTGKDYLQSLTTSAEFRHELVTYLSSLAVAPGRSRDTLFASNSGDFIKEQENSHENRMIP